ncbi:MAG: carboxypeptidase regulatory-like domain-containing protein [Proteobacteria bacterium]|nr:carboxypeptidase regulatory-like domain-containing protein [Pseudomonadota bacterium]MCP4919165.1 carboxypeptidase regulatory-like domain-containing protein [Pseudomonadota bacterium]
MSLLLLSVACMDTELHQLDDVTANEFDSSVHSDTGEPDPNDTGEPDNPDYDAGVTGRICDPSGGDWVVGAIVWIDTGEVRSEDTTDVDGRFQLTGLPAGTWTVHVEKGSFATEFEVTLNGGMYEIPDPECLLPPEIMVVTGAYDSIEDVLDRMSVDYELTQGVSGSQHVNFLKDVDRMKQYDIIFLNCGMNDNWVNSKSEIAANIKEYVTSGGSVYTSDWSYYAFEVAFPDAVDFYGDDNISGSAYAGEAETVTAAVKDANMQTVLGKNTASINYDLASWAIMESSDSSATDLLTGDVKYFDWNTWSSGTLRDVPLAVRIKPNGGNMIYTSFHNERQTTGDMDKMLEEIILSL